MNTYAAIAFAVALTVWAVVAWDLGRKWLAERTAIALHKRMEEHERTTAAAVETNKRALENLVKETAEELHSMRSQQVGAIAGMQAAASRPRSFQR